MHESPCADVSEARNYWVWANRTKPQKPAFPSACVALIFSFCLSSLVFLSLLLSGKGLVGRQCIHRVEWWPHIHKALEYLEHGHKRGVVLLACNHSPEEVKTWSSKVLGHARLHRELEILPETKSGVKKKEGEREGKTKELRQGGKETGGRKKGKGRGREEERKIWCKGGDKSSGRKIRKKKKSKNRVLAECRERALGGRSYRSLEKGPVWARAGSLRSLWRPWHCTSISLLAAIY